MTNWGFYGLLLRSLPIWKPTCCFKGRKVELQIAGSSTPQPLIQAIIIILLPPGKTLCLTADQLLQAWLTAAGQRLPVSYIECACKVCVCVCITKQCSNSSLSRLVSSWLNKCPPVPTPSNGWSSPARSHQNKTLVPVKYHLDNCSQMYLIETAKAIKWDMFPCRVNSVSE